MNLIETVNQELAPLIQKIKHHDLYGHIHSLEDLGIFMSYHVFAVWDFMCLLKELHREIVTTKAPWFPPKDAYSAYLIGRILLEEESDLSDGSHHFSQNIPCYCSHFEMYLKAMNTLETNTLPIQEFLYRLSRKESLRQAAAKIGLPSAILKFVQVTFSFFSKETHKIAAAFVYGREAITSSLFTPLVRQLELTIPSEQKHLLKNLLYYLNRHIELDDADHLPRAQQMLINLAGDDPQKWQEISSHAKIALNARLDFLTAIQLRILDKSQELSRG